MKTNAIAVAILIVSIQSILIAEVNYRGYSGAPGSRGTCAESCHGYSGGTIEVIGFPEEYLPDEVYTVSVKVNSGSSIRQFNGSARLGTGSQNAGVISGGFRTRTYSVSQETNGIRLSNSYQDSVSFEWTAPPEGSGEVRLYIAGTQGGYSGYNSTIVLVANEPSTDIETKIQLPEKLTVNSNYPNPFNATTTISFSLPTEEFVTISIYNIAGQLVEKLIEADLSAGYHSIAWNADDYVSGIYVYSIQVGDHNEKGSMTLLK